MRMSGIELLLRGPLGPVVLLAVVAAVLLGAALLASWSADRSRD